MKKIAFILLFFTAIAVAARPDSGKLFFAQDTDTLNILITMHGGVYYYTSPLADDASNFKSIVPKDIDVIIRIAEQEAKEKDHSLIVVIKSEQSKKAVDIARWYKKYTRGKLTKTEKQLIRVTEKAKSGKK